MKLIVCEKCKKEISNNGKICPNCGNPMTGSFKTEKRRKLLVLFLLIGALILASLGVFALFEFDVIDFSKESKAVSEAKEYKNVDIGYTSAEKQIKDEDKVKKYKNGDIVYIPGEKQIDYDEAEYIIFYNNLLFVYTSSDLSVKEAEKLAKSVDGEVVGDISGSVNCLQIRVEESTVQELKDKSDILMENENVVYANYDFPNDSTIDTADFQEVDNR